MKSILYLFLFLPIISFGQHIVIKGVTPAKDLPGIGGKVHGYLTVGDTVPVYGFISSHFCIKYKDEMRFAPDKHALYIGPDMKDSLVAAGERIYKPLRLTNIIPEEGSFKTKFKSTPGVPVGGRSTYKTIKTKPASGSYPCGAKTSSGGYCKRLVKGGSKCWQHGG